MRLIIEKRGDRLMLRAWCSTACFGLILLGLSCAPPPDFFTCDQVTGTRYSVTVGSVMLSWRERHATLDIPVRYVGGGHELIYAGIDQSVIQVKYREYALTERGEFAREAFYLDLKYDLSKSREITYQDAVIRVDSADSRGVTYTIHQLPTPPATETAGRIGIVVGADGDIQEVHPGSPAARAGLRVGDVIRRIDDVIIYPGEAASYQSRIIGRVGTTVKLFIVRDGREHEVTVRREGR